MAPPDPDRRRILRGLFVAATALLAGCGETDRTTPEPAPPPNETGATATDAFGPGPEGDETPIANDTAPPPTGTAVPNDVVFSKPGGGEVAGTMYGGGDCAVVLVPQVDMDRQSWDQYGKHLAERGYRALAIDEGEDRKAAGVEGAVRFLRNTVGVTTVIVVGASTGGEAAVRAAVDRPESVDGVVTISAAGGQDVAGQLTMPTLFVVSEADAQRFVTTAEALVDGAPGETELITLEGDAHGQHLFQSPHAEMLRTRIDRFVEAVCLPAKPTPTGTGTTSP